MNRTHQELLRSTLEGSEGEPSVQASQATASSTLNTMPVTGTGKDVDGVGATSTPGRAGASPASAGQVNAAFVPAAGPLGKPMRWQPVVADLPSLQPRTSAAEQFRRLRSRLLEYRGAGTLKTVLLSSALPQEGKSFVAANLAVGLSQHRGTRVLLIDGDMRRYSLQRYFGSTHQPGLADYLAGTAEADDVMQRADEATLAAFPGLTHLTLIPGGGMVEHVTDLSEDSRFGALIKQVEPFFDWIIVDSSPVTLVSDAINLARHCDGVLLVVRSGVTEYQQAQKAQSELQASNLIGVVLNAVEDRPAPSYYGYGPAGAGA
ncbi:MAG: CpsD/CapB family tyrosine-protein kinase [Janthinobacterium lividum]